MAKPVGGTTSLQGYRSTHAYSEFTAALALAGCYIPYHDGSMPRSILKIWDGQNLAIVCDQLRSSMAALRHVLSTYDIPVSVENINEGCAIVDTNVLRTILDLDR